MKPASLFATTLIFIATATSSFASDAELEAEGVLERYFAALVQGDTVTLRSLMGGQLLEKRSVLLGNPAYSAHLQQTYGGARFSIENTSINGGDVIVEVSIALGGNDVSFRQFVLRREPQSNDGPSTFRIYREN